MSEGSKESFPVKKDTISTKVEKIFHGISESKIDTAIERVLNKKGVRIDKDTLIAIIEDIEARRDQGASFREARTFATRLFAGDHGEGYWTAVLSALGMVYPHKKKNPVKKDTKSYKDFY